MLQALLRPGRAPARKADKERIIFSAGKVTPIMPVEEGNTWLAFTFNCLDNSVHTCLAVFQPLFPGRAVCIARIDDHGMDQAAGAAQMFPSQHDWGRYNLIFREHGSSRCAVRSKHKGQIEFAACLDSRRDCGKKKPRRWA